MPGAGWHESSLSISGNDIVMMPIGSSYLID